MSMAAAKRTTGAEEWWEILPERDTFEHSQNYARRRITPPCQNCGPVRNDWKAFRCARMSVASDAYANNLENQRRVLADCEQVFEDVGRGAP